MRDVTKIDFSKPFGKVRAMDPAKQKVYFTQEGIDYDAGGNACNAKQVKDYATKQAAEAQRVADEYKEQAAQMQKQADEVLKAAGMNKTQARKAG